MSDKYNNLIMIIVILIPTGVIIYQMYRSWRLRKVFNFGKELRKIRKQKPQPIKQDIENGILIGYSGRRPIIVPDNAKHVFICGTTGSGKTVAISNFVKRVIDKDYPALIIDGKGDTGEGSILDIVTTLNNNKKKLYVINLSEPEKSDKYNPFRNASTTMARDMLINMTDWSEEHYKLNAERYLQRILQLFKIAGAKPTFQRIVKYLPLENFETLSAHLLKKDLITKQDHLANIDISSTSGKIAQASTARFSTIAESEVGTIFADNGIDISHAMQENAIILFILNPLVYPELSPAFGRLVLIDAKIAVGNLFKNHVPKSFFIMDEINSYATTGLTDLVNKSRSAGVTCVLATQSLSDLDFACGDAYKEQIIENCNNYLVMRQNSGVNAENWANILGTRSTMEVTHQLQQQGLNTSETGFGSARLVREYLYHPDDIKALHTGKGIYLSRDTNTNDSIAVNKPF